MAIKNMDDLSVDEWKRYDLTVTIPPDTTQADFGVRVREHPAQGDLLVDAFQVEQNSHVSTYCDGDQGKGYAWVDVPHTSTSTRAQTYVQYQSADVSLSAGSIATWMKPGQFYDWPYIFGSYPGKFDAYLDASGNIHFRVYDDAGENGANIAYELGMDAAGDWHHSVYVWSQTAIDGYNMWLYVDGVLRDQSTNTYWPTSLPPDYTRLQPGARRVVAEFSTFDRALTPDEVAALYSRGVSASR